MSEVAGSIAIDIPRRALFKAAEVCELVRLQPYVLRSWEAEFPRLGVAKTGGGSRVYRREDVERVVRIRDLLLVEGLTLAGVRKRLEEESTPVGADVPGIDELIGEHARERLTDVKHGLRAILELLAAGPDVPGPRPAIGPVAVGGSATGRTGARPRGKPAASGHQATERPHARRKRSA
jgi:DNA-binding transcriptional MerR regulator